LVAIFRKSRSSSRRCSRHAATAAANPSSGRSAALRASTSALALGENLLHRINAGTLTGDGIEIGHSN
jgi:hypothetical protein